MIIFVSCCILYWTFHFDHFSYFPGFLGVTFCPAWRRSGTMPKRTLLHSKTRLVCMTPLINKGVERQEAPQLVRNGCKVLCVNWYLQGNIRALWLDDTKVHSAASRGGQLARCQRAEGHVVDPTWHGDAGQQLKGLAAPQSHLWIRIISCTGKMAAKRRKVALITTFSWNTAVFQPVFSLGAKKCELSAGVTDQQTERGDRPWRRPDSVPSPYGKWC